MASLFKQSLRPLAAAVLTLCLVLAAATFAILRDTYYRATDNALSEAALALGAAVPEDALSEAGQAWVEKVADRSSFRLTLVRMDGSIIADSDAAPAGMANHAFRPEIRKALAGEVGIARRTSATVGMEMNYSAVPLRDEFGQIIAVLRIAVDLPTLRSRLNSAYLTFLVVAALAAAVSIAGAIIFSRAVARPLGTLAAAAAAFSAGEPSAFEASEASTEAALGQLKKAAAQTGPDEVKILGQALESMAAELARRIQTAESRERETRAILNGMSDAVLALDSDLNIRQANNSARALFGLNDPATDIDKRSTSLLKATRSSRLEATALEALATGKTIESELNLYYKDGERSFQVIAASFKRPGATAEKPEGIVLALADITKLKKLERVRKDFVANVSHELRTPIQLVRGFAESLLGGALDDPEKARRFTGIIERNAERMGNLIDDLLTLAKLEQTGTDRFETAPESIRPLIAEAIAAVEEKAKAKGIAIETDCRENLSAEVNGGLVIQALINLLDNAIKYSNVGAPIIVTARVDDKHFKLEVRDRGIGIPAADLPRIFERFYRVDKARSREQGGTGLGLAIVRHIAAAHHGSAVAESWEGEGSVFRIDIPAAPIR